MAVAVADEAAKLKAQLSEAKKRASDLQGDADRFAVERKSFADIGEENERLKGELADANKLAADLASELSDAKGELAKVNKALAKVESQVGAVQKIKEGLAELG